MVSSKRARGESAQAGPSKKVKIEILSDDDSYSASSTYSDEDEDDVYYDPAADYVPNGKAPATRSGARNGAGKGKSVKRKAPGKGKEGADSNVSVATKAEILSLATDDLPGGKAKEKLEGIDEAVIQRIKKALSLGTHEGTGEAEAKAAMRLASKLMAQHNVNQADILASEDEEQKLKRAGQSTVAVRSQSGARVILHAWSMVVAQAVEKFFDCKSYSISMGNRVDWTFYGLAEQTVAAAYAYEMVYNLILTWSAQNKEAKGRTQKNNYCYGVADGLYDLAVKERKEEERRAIKKEKERLALAAKAEAEEREKELDRLKHQDEETKVKVEEVREDEEDEKKVKVEVEQEPDVPVPNDDEPYSDGEDYAEPAGGWGGGDGYGYGDGFLPDFNAEEEDLDAMVHDLDTTGHIKVKRDSPAPKKEEVKPVVKLEEDDTPWQSGQQLTLFRNNASNIADDYIKKSKIKLRSGPKIGGPNFKKGGYSNYKQGKEDAKKIDVKRKRIKGAGQD